MTDIPIRLIHSYAQCRELLGGVPSRTFELWIANGLIKPVRIGARRSFVRHEDLIALIESASLPKAG